MNDFFKWVNDLDDEIALQTQVLVNAALDMPTPQKSKQFLRDMKQNYESTGFAGTTKDAKSRLINSMIEDAYQEIDRRANQQRWNKGDKK